VSNQVDPFIRPFFDVPANEALPLAGPIASNCSEKGRPSGKAAFITQE